MMLLDAAGLVLLAGGLFFFVAGTVALVRFPDLYCRLHALTKADNLGLGLVVLATMLLLRSPRHLPALALVWVMAQAASSVVCFLVAREARRRGIEPRRREG